MINEKQPPTKEIVDAEKRPNLNDPKTIDTILKTIANGGSLIELSKAWNVRYGNIIGLVFTDVQRKVFYHEAIFARYEWAFRPMLELLDLVHTLDKIEESWKVKFKNLIPEETPI